MEDYFGSKFHTETSHGICPECARKTMGRVTVQGGNITVPPIEPKK
jgi:hypothetical protein